MSQSEITLRGFAELIRALNNTPEIAAPILERGMNLALSVVEGNWKPYPPATESNRPGRWKEVKNKNGSVSLRPVGYYERHRGYWYPVMRRRTLGGKRLKSQGAMTARAARKQHGMSGSGGVAGYKLRPSSEFLGQSVSEVAFVRDIKTERAAITGTLRTNVSYAKFVIGPRTIQSRVMKRIGWVTIDEALERSREGVMEAFKRAEEELIKALADRTGRP